MPERRDTTTPPVCMVFDHAGNAYQAFEYTPEELERHAAWLRGVLTFESTVPVTVTSSFEVNGG